MTIYNGVKACILRVKACILKLKRATSVLITGNQVDCSDRTDSPLNTITTNTIANVLRFVIGMLYNGCTNQNLIGRSA